MDSTDLPGIIFASIIGAITVIVIIALIFARILDRKGIKNSKKIDAGSDGNDSVYLS